MRTRAKNTSNQMTDEALEDRADRASISRRHDESATAPLIRKDPVKTGVTLPGPDPDVRGARTG
jgi:hypothetical protein